MYFDDWFLIAACRSLKAKLNFYLLGFTEYLNHIMQFQFPYMLFPGLLLLLFMHMSTICNFLLNSNIHTFSDGLSQ